MKVNLVHSTSAPGGIEILSARMVKFYRAADFRIFTIRPPRPGATDVYEETGVTRVSGSRHNPVAFCRLWSFAYRYREEVFHLMNTGPFFLLCVRLAGVRKVVYSIRGTKYWEGAFQKYLMKLFWKMALSGGIRLVANSEHSKKVFMENISCCNDIKVIYNPVSSPRFEVLPETERQGGKLKIIYVGRLNPGKNLEKWIDVACYVHSRLENVYFEIYGSGPLEGSLRRQIDDCGAGDYIKLKGFREDIENVYRSADLFLFLSEYESFGNVVVESILCGTPVVASAIPSIREIFADYPDFLIEPGEDLNLQVLEKIKMYGYLRSLARKAGAQFRERFSMKQHAEKIAEVYGCF